MCLAAIALDQHPDFPFVCIANRDEFHARPSETLKAWPEFNPTLYAGQDLQSGGTWLGVDEHGHFALLTNVRNPALNMPDTAPSRGALVINAIRDGGVLPPAQHSLNYAGFNLFAGDLKTNGLRYCSNQWLKLGHQNRPYERHLGAGVHCLSNGHLESGWPKSMRLKTGLGKVLQGAQQSSSFTEALFDLLQDTSTADDASLPSTGVPYEWEKMLSAIKIVSPMYGTRSSAVLVKHRSGQVDFIERCHNAEGKLERETAIQWCL